MHKCTSFIFARWLQGHRRKGNGASQKRGLLSLKATARKDLTKMTMTFVEGPGKNRDWPCPTVGKRVPEGWHSTGRGSEERAGEGVGGQEKCPESGGDGRLSRS